MIAKNRRNFVEKNIEAFPAWQINGRSTELLLAQKLGEMLKSEFARVFLLKRFFAAAFSTPKPMPKTPNSSRTRTRWFSLGRFKDTRGIVKTPDPTKATVVMISGKQYFIHVSPKARPAQAQGQNEVNHKDGNPSNNRLDNLEWATHSENMRHSYAADKNQPSAPKRSAGRGGAGREGWRTRAGGEGSGVDSGASVNVAVNLGRRRAATSSAASRTSRRCCRARWEAVREREGLLARALQDSGGVVETPIPEEDGYVYAASTARPTDPHPHREGFDLPRHDDQHEVNHKDGNP